MQANQYYSQNSNIQEEYQPQDLSRSIIREYLIKLNLKQTYEKFNSEDTRTRVKITKIDLINQLAMEKLIRNNKLKEKPLPTMIDVLTHYLNSKFLARKKNEQNNYEYDNNNTDILDFKTYKIEDLSRNLIREFMIKENLVNTLNVFTEEDQRPREKMTRIQLMQQLSMERLMKNNKQQQFPLNTMLDVLTQYLQFKSQQMQNDDTLTTVSSQTNSSNVSSKIIKNQYNFNNNYMNNNNNQMIKSDNDYSKNGNSYSNISNGSNKQFSQTQKSQRPQMKANNFTGENNNNNQENSYNIQDQETINTQNIQKKNSQNYFKNTPTLQESQNSYFKKKPQANSANLQEKTNNIDKNNNNNDNFSRQSSNTIKKQEDFNNNNNIQQSLNDISSISNKNNNKNNNNNEEFFNSNLNKFEFEKEQEFDQNSNQILEYDQQEEKQQNQKQKQEEQLKQQQEKQEIQQNQKQEEKVEQQKEEEENYEQDEYEQDEYEQEEYEQEDEKQEIKQENESQNLDSEILKPKNQKTQSEVISSEDIYKNNEIFNKNDNEINNNNSNNNITSDKNLSNKSFNKKTKSEQLDLQKEKNKDINDLDLDDFNPEVEKKKENTENKQQNNNNTNTNNINNLNNNTNTNTNNNNNVQELNKEKQKEEIKVDENQVFYGGYGETNNQPKNRFKKRGQKNNNAMNSIFEQAEQQIEQKQKEEEEEQKRKQEEEKKKLQEQELARQKQIDELDELDNMFGGGENTQKQKISNTNKIWEEEDPYQKKDQENKVVKKELEVLDYVPLDLLKPGKLSFEKPYPKLDFYKQSQINMFSKNIQSIENKQIQAIKKLLFASAPVQYLPNSWSQGFIFRNDDPEKYYGLLQKEGGPCGVIASVQAYYLKWLFFIAANNQEQTKDFFSNPILKENLLLASLADILWKCSDKKIVKLAVVNNAVGQEKAAGIENCGQITLKVNSFEQLYEAMHQYKEEYLGEFQSGVATFIYSLVLTKGPETIQKEFDMEFNGLIGEHGHCSQEGVNLLLTGYAHSNVFDGVKDMDGMVLKGIKERSEFGFMTIHEHYDYVKVGDNLKTPYYPIWVICKEYHYSVIFGKDSRCNENLAEKFDVIYYDELYNTEDRLLLTVTVSDPEKEEKLNVFGKKIEDENNKEDEDMIPMLELVMRTKWGKKIKVDWNESTVIL